MDFPWAGQSFAGFPGLDIVDAAPALRQLDDDLAHDEKRDLRAAKHWLTSDWTHGTSPSPGETTNLVLLAIWLVKPTATVRQHASSALRTPCVSACVRSASWSSTPTTTLRFPQFVMRWATATLRVRGLKETHCRSKKRSRMPNADVVNANDVDRMGFTDPNRTGRRTTRC